MQILHVYPDRCQDPHLALTRQRDVLLSEALKSPSQAREAAKTLTIECVTETLRLTGLPVSFQQVAEVSKPVAGLSERAGTIWGQFEALQSIEQAARPGASLNVALLREVHRLSNPPAGGVFRRGAGRAHFAGATPSRPEIIADQLGNLMEWLAADSGSSLNLPGRATLAFVRLLEISPFEAGNFRAAHLLLNFFAYSEDYPPFFLLAEEAEEIRQEVEQALRFETLPLATRMARALSRSLSFCLDAVGRP